MLIFDKISQSIFFFILINLPIFEILDLPTKLSVALFNHSSHLKKKISLSEVVSYWEKYGHLVQVNRLGSVDRLTDRAQNDINSIEELINQSNPYLLHMYGMF